jgi:hypothetical protein
MLSCFQTTNKRKVVSTDKFYFIDLGVARNLARIGFIAERSKEFGDALEHLVFLEIQFYRDYQHKDCE